VSGRKYTGKEIEQIMLLAQDVISLNTPITNNGETQDTDTELGDFIKDPNPTPEEEAMITNRHEVITSYLQKYLSPRERQIIILRFGLESGRPMRLEEIGREYGLSRERVRQIETKALRKLRLQFARNKITWENI
jgi:RNA polymerase primary sigma factor